MPNGFKSRKQIPIVNLGPNSTEITYVFPLAESSRLWLRPVLDGTPAQTPGRASAEE